MGYGLLEHSFHLKNLQVITEAKTKENNQLALKLRLLKSKEVQRHIDIRYKRNWYVVITLLYIQKLVLQKTKKNRYL